MQAQNYEKARVAVDAVIFTIKNRSLKVYLNKREKGPFLGRAELPGGLLTGKETAEQCLSRKLGEELGQKQFFFTQFYTATEPSRDPRTRTVSICFIALVNINDITDPEMLFPYDSLPQMAFDHKSIISKAREYLKNNLNSIIVKQFLPEEFPLNSLQDAYSVISSQEYDNRNFRKKMLSSGLVIQTRKSEQDVSHRPAKLYRFCK
jgi:8-oxo-dGTP diphosphatase